MNGYRYELTDFEPSMAAEAQALALADYIAAREAFASLPHPETVELPGFTPQSMGPGVAALRGGSLCGFISPFPAFATAFGYPDTPGAYCPVGRNGALQGPERGRIFSEMYRWAAERWAAAGIISHAITLWASDGAALSSFFWNGFGVNCVDAIRPLGQHAPADGLMEAAPLHGESYAELEPRRAAELLVLREMLVGHLAASPCFRYYRKPNGRELEKRAETVRSFTASVDGSPVAFIDVCAEGENFSTETASMRSICGAFCLPEYRGGGVMRGLLRHVAATLGSEGFRLLGVDYESINSAASGFWRKYFTLTTMSVVRRIDLPR